MSRIVHRFGKLVSIMKGNSEVYIQLQLSDEANKILAYKRKGVCYLTLRYFYLHFLQMLQPTDTVGAKRVWLSQATGCLVDAQIEQKQNLRKPLLYDTKSKIDSLILLPLLPLAVSYLSTTLLQLAHFN